MPYKVSNFPDAIASLLEASLNPQQFFTGLMPAVGQALHCDRCFLYLRNPETSVGRVAFYWVRHRSIPVVHNRDWQSEPAELPTEDPMFAAALAAKPSIFVEDVENASPNMLNQRYEQENFGHRALIHGHICQDGQLWGVIQPCVFGQPRVWTEAERAMMHQLIDEITPRVIDYVKSSLSAE